MPAKADRCLPLSQKVKLPVKAGIHYFLLPDHILWWTSTNGDKADMHA